MKITDDIKKSGAGDITPDTKVGNLLKNFPQLEEKLFELSPAFKKLRNPILRKTIGRVATLRQAAEVGNISLGMMINTLRKTAGLNEMTDITDSKSEDSDSIPEWVSSAGNIREFDARSIIEAGEHPLNSVIKEVHSLEKNEGFQAWSKIESAETAYTYFKKSVDK